MQDSKQKPTGDEETGRLSEETKGEVTLVTKLDEREGISIGEKVDNLIKKHPVVMFNRSWCLFSIDAIDFLKQLNVHVYSLEVDKHPFGGEIFKYLSQKYDHKTTPLIFISGDFLGGFEDVNAMYSTGNLQNQYISRLSSKEKCEKMAAISTRQPLFWFPDSVNGNVVRCTGILTSVTSMGCVVASYLTNWGYFIACYLVLDFVLRILAGSKLSILGQMATVLTLFMKPDPRAGRPKQFASMCGLMFSLLGSAFYLARLKIVGSIFIAGLAGATGLEGFADYCLGCVFFRIGIQLGLIPK